MKLSELFWGMDVFCPEELLETEISSITSDSRRATPGSLFVCIDGERDDGEKYADVAKANGATVLHRVSFPGEAFASDTRSILTRLCARINGCDKLKMKLVGVTGTNGKTTVTEMLGSIFKKSGVKCGKIGTLGMFSGETRLETKVLRENAHMTTPEPEVLYPALAKMQMDGCRYVFMEVSSHALAQKRVDALDFEVGIFTNLTRDHLDFHGSFENYLKAKKRLSGLCKKFIVNADDPFYSSMSESFLTCSAKSFADFMAHPVELYGERGCSYRLLSNRGAFNVKCRIPGAFTVMNTLEAAACALTFGVDPEAIADGIFDTDNVPGRMEAVKVPDTDISVYIDYAHTPDALENLLLTARNFAKEKKVTLVFGCGGERDRGKRKLMGAVATKYADLAVITSDNSRSENKSIIIDDILLGIDKEKCYTVIEDRESAIEYAITHANPGDIVLLAGKGHEKYEIDERGTHMFDEAELVKRFIQERKA